MFKIIGTPNIDFQGSRHFWMTFSLIAIILGIGGIIYKGGLKWSIDFTGGISVVLRPTPPPGESPITEEAMRRALLQVGVSGAEVKTSRSMEGEDIIIRMSYLGRFRPPETLIRAALDERMGGQWQIVPSNQLNPLDLEPLKGKSFVAITGEITESEIRSVLEKVEIDSPFVSYHKTLDGDTIFIVGGEGKDPISRLLKVLRHDFPHYQFDVRSVDLVGPRIGSELRLKAIWA
ncbi:MAG: hypothetical protein ACK4OO_05635, partial [bacterium]